jgi:hypothetical protein
VATEKRLRARLVEAFRHAGACWWVVDDPPGAQFLGTLRFTRKRPFDYLVVHAGVPYAVECKVARPSFRLRPHQEAELARMERVGGGASVIAVFCRARGERVWSLWWLPFRAYRAYLAETSRASFPASALPGRASLCRRIGGVFILPFGSPELVGRGRRILGAADDRAAAARR